MLATNLAAYGFPRSLRKPRAAHSSNFLACDDPPTAVQPVLDRIPDSQMWDSMYALGHIVDFSNLLDIRFSEPLPDEIDRQDQLMDAKLRTESASSPASDLEKAIFGAP